MENQERAIQVEERAGGEELGMFTRRGQKPEKPTQVRNGANGSRQGRNEPDLVHCTFFQSTGKPLKDFEQWDVDWVNWIYIFKKVTAGVGGGYWLERSRKLNNEVIQEAIAIGQVREDAGLSSDGRNGDGVKWTDTT